MNETTKPNSVCPRCNREFECGISAGKNSCWCFDHQVLTADKTGDRCFCEQCLKELTAQQTAPEEKS